MESLISRFFDYLFGLLIIWLSLGALSAVPVLHFLTLGYFLAASARVAKSGRIRDGLIGLKTAARIGKILLAAWLLFVPVRLLHSYWYDAQIIDPNSGSVKNLASLLIIWIVTVTLFILWAILRGGRLRNFTWPAPARLIRWMGAPKSFISFVPKFSPTKIIRLFFGYFKLGFFGFVGGAIWLLIPVLILFLAPLISSPVLSALVSLLGTILLGIVALYVPFLQTRYAVSRRFLEFKNWRVVREEFRKAPLALWLALFVTLLFALPLYILKIELTPREVAWIPNLVFVLFMYPARLLLGWANSRAIRREDRSHWVWRIFGRLGMFPSVVVYVFVVWISQYLSWHGSYSLFEQHAFLLPAPMLGM